MLFLVDTACYMCYNGFILQKHEVTLDKSEIVSEIIGLYDPHLPFHNRTLLSKALDVIDEYKPALVVLGGDIMELSKVSRHGKDPRTADSLPEALAETKKLLKDIRERAPESRIIYKEGNHDIRLQAYIAQNAPELALLPELELSNLLGLDDMDIEFHGYRTHLVVDGLCIRHGSRNGGESGYAAHAERRAAGGLSGMSGHVHRLAFVKSYGAAWVECGCLLDRKSRAFDYMGEIGTANWHNGFMYGFKVKTTTKNKKGRLSTQEQWILNPIEAFGPNDDSFILKGKLW